MSRDLASGLFWLALSLFVCVEGFTALRLGTLRQPGPGFFPFWGGVLLGMLSLILLVGAVRSGVPLRFGDIRWPVLVSVVCLLPSYLLLLETLGFPLVTFFFLLLLFRLGETGWGKSAAWSLVATSLAHALFRLWLRVQLPPGPLGL